MWSLLSLYNSLTNGKELALALYTYHAGCKPSRPMKAPWWMSGPRCLKTTRTAYKREVVTRDCDHQSGSCSRWRVWNACIRHRSATTRRVQIAKRFRDVLSVQGEDSNNSRARNVDRRHRPSPPRYTTAAHQTHSSSNRKHSRRVDVYDKAVSRSVVFASWLAAPTRRY